MTDKDTSLEAVERFNPIAVAPHDADPFGAMETDSEGGFVLYDDYAALSAALEAEKDKLLTVSKREAATIARYDAKLDAAEAERNALKAELAEAVEVTERLCKEASITSKRGAVTGSHWTHLGMAILKTRAFLARHQKEPDT